MLLGENLDIPFYKIDGENLPFADKSFDIVLTMFVLQHDLDVNSLNRLYEEISRVLDDEGKLINFERVSIPQYKRSYVGGKRTWRIYKAIRKTMILNLLIIPFSVHVSGMI
jgi:ubiquinone/menaquinone biosynthesis C-methylase UbiE